MYVTRVPTRSSPPAVLLRESWREGGGSVGSIMEWNGILVVTQTREAQRDVSRLLNGLRRRPATRPVRW